MYRSIPLHTDDPYVAHPHHAGETNKHHPAKHGPEGNSVSRHERIGRRPVGVRRAVRHRRGNDLCHAQSNGAAELRARVEHSAAQGLRMAGEDIGNNEQADGKEQITADRGKNLDD